MANQWSGTIATQTVAFRGTSTVFITPTFTEFPNTRTVSAAAYILGVSGGVSGSFGVTVRGRIGREAQGANISLAGVTAISASGDYVLFPYGYSVSGIGTLSNQVDVLQRIDQIVPPSSVIFQSGVATAGISAYCIVSAVMRTRD